MNSLFYSVFSSRGRKSAGMTAFLFHNDYMSINHCMWVTLYVYKKFRVVYESFKKNGLFNVQMRIHFLLPFANYLLLFASSFGLLFMSGFHSRQFFFSNQKVSVICLVMCLTMILNNVRIENMHIEYAYIDNLTIKGYVIHIFN